MARRGRNPVARRRPDGRYDLVLNEHARGAVRGLIVELGELVTSTPDDPDLKRLQPPAYLDDPDRDAAYQLLAGDELRSSRTAGFEAVLRTLDQDVVEAEDLWAWLRSLNALRLATAGRLKIEDETDHQRGPIPIDHPDAGLWAIYELATDLQYEIMRALRP
jgi:hypothetical protein